jgi:hypothetical protein
MISLCFPLASAGAWYLSLIVAKRLGMAGFRLARHSGIKQENK